MNHWSSRVQPLSKQQSITQHCNHIWLQSANSNYILFGVHTYCNCTCSPMAPLSLTDRQYEYLVATLTRQFKNRFAHQEQLQNKSWTTTRGWRAWHATNTLMFDKVIDLRIVRRTERPFAQSQQSVVDKWVEWQHRKNEWTKKTKTKTKTNIICKIPMYQSKY